MYKNNQIDVLQKCIDNGLFLNAAEIVDRIKSEYAQYNEGYGNYTQKYISTIENVYDKLEIDQCLPEEYGGKWKGIEKEANENTLYYLLEKYRVTNDVKCLLQT